MSLATRNDLTVIALAVAYVLGIVSVHHYRTPAKPQPLTVAYHDAHPTLEVRP